MKLENVLVTGAYGGMGSAMVKALAERGVRVFALDLRVGEPIDNVISIEADITSEDSVRSAFHTVGKYTDTLSAIVHFAGIYMLDSLVEMEPSAFKRIFDVNLYGVYLVNREFLPMLGRDSRIVITTSELAPLDPLPFTGIYAVSKGALEKYAYSLAMELQLLGVRVSVIRAGAVNTGMLGTSTTALDRFCEKTEHYAFGADKFKSIVDSVEARHIAPEKIAGLAISILEKRRPAFAYSINRNPLLCIMGVLPKRMQMGVIRQILKKKEK